MEKVTRLRNQVKSPFESVEAKKAQKEEDVKVREDRLSKMGVELEAKSAAKTKL